MNIGSCYRLTFEWGENKYSLPSHQRDYFVFKKMIYDYENLKLVFIVVLFVIHVFYCYISCFGKFIP